MSWALILPPVRHLYTLPVNMMDRHFYNPIRTPGIHTYTSIHHCNLINGICRSPITIIAISYITVVYLTALLKTYTELLQLPALYVSASPFQ